MRKAWIRWWGIVALLTLGGITGCSDELPENANGKELYHYYCASCHKDSGKGDFIKGIPANASSRLTEKQIYDLIRHGRSDKPGMPRFENLTKEQAALIAAYLTNQLR